MLGEVVVNDQDIATRLHEMFSNAGGGVWRDI